MIPTKPLDRTTNLQETEDGGPYKIAPRISKIYRTNFSVFQHITSVIKNGGIWMGENYEIKEI